VLCAELDGLGRARTTGFVIFWASAMPPEIRTTATTAANLIKPSIYLEHYTKEQVGFHSSFVFCSFRRPQVGKILQVIWTSGVICANLWRAEKFLSRIIFICHKYDLRTTAGELSVHPPLVSHTEFLTCSGS
jgi:hypothetical protein